MFLFRWLQTVLFPRPSLKPRRTRPARGLRHPRAPGLERLEDRTLLAAAAVGDLYFSVGRTANDAPLPDVGAVDGSDVIHWDGDAFQWFFDGSDVGVGAADVDGVAILNESEFLISFLRTTDVPGIGTVDGAGIVKFAATSLGETTAGAFSRFFDGGPWGLSGPAGNVDAFDLLSDGSLVISVEGHASLPAQGHPSSGMVVAEDKDLLRFVPDAAGDYTSGTWSLYFDGSDAELTFPSEDVDAVSIADDGRLFLSTWGSFFTAGFGGGNEDVVEFAPESLGEQTSGSYVHPLLFNGSEVAAEFFQYNIDAVDLHIAEATAVNAPPVAESQSVRLDEDSHADVRLTGDDGDAEFEQSLTFAIVEGPQHGTLVDFDPQTGEVAYLPDADFNGLDHFTFVVTDDESINGEALTSEPATVHFTIDAVNDAPANTLPTGEQIGNEDVPLVVQGISVQDRDAVEGDGMLSVSLVTGSGRVTVIENSAFHGEVRGNGTRTVELTGTIDELNALFAAGVTYRGDLNFHGDDTLHIATNDRGNRGKGGPLWARDQVPIHIRSVTEQRDALIAQVQALVENGALKHGEGRSLIGKLEFGNLKSAAQRVCAFIKHTETLIRRGVLTDAVGTDLIESADTLLAGLEVDRNGNHGRGRGGNQQIDGVFSNLNGLFDELDRNRPKGQHGNSGRGRGQ